MIKIIIFGFITIFLIASSVYLIHYNFRGNEPVENYTGGMNQHGELYPEKCINGIVYYNQGIALAIAGKPNGMFYTCTRK